MKYKIEGDVECAYCSSSIHINDTLEFNHHGYYNCDKCGKTNEFFVNTFRINDKRSKCD